jgi:hypothetical protein
MFNKIFGYFKYRKIIKQNFETLSQRYKLRYDKVYGRLYTIISIPERRQEVLRNYKIPGNIQNPKETDVNAYLDTEVRSYINAIEEYFYTIGLFELVSIAKIDSVDDVNVLLVLRYKFNNHRRFLYFVIGIVSFILSLAFIAGFIKFILFLINFIIAL